MDRALRAWTLELGISDIGISELKLSYTIYGCMLLLGHNAYESRAWQHLQQNRSQTDFERLYELLGHHLKVTHIAINKPIPLRNEDESAENVIRSPSNFTPLYGDFGPETSSSPPTPSDFEAAFWVTAKQNGIFQTWAPRWTMFSRGNISEKARILTLPSVNEAVEQGKADARGSAAVDLYAGIGYFAFSYLKAGIDKVICWDINPWSIEGLRRGAKANKWSTVIYSHKDSIEDFAATKARLLAFNESNEYAQARIKATRATLPPIRHVNCGLLPTSAASRKVALEIVDRELGGWIHHHENFAFDEIGQKAEEARAELQEMLMRDGRTGAVKIEETNRVKSYAPGVMHCVLDIHIPANEPPPP